LLNKKFNLLAFFLNLLKN